MITKSYITIKNLNATYMLRYNHNSLEKKLGFLQDVARRVPIYLIDNQLMDKICPLRRNKELEIYEIFNRIRKELDLKVELLETNWVTIGCYISDVASYSCLERYYKKMGLWGGPAIFIAPERVSGVATRNRISENLVFQKCVYHELGHAYMDNKKNTKNLNSSYREIIEESLANAIALSCFFDINNYYIDNYYYHILYHIKRKARFSSENYLKTFLRNIDYYIDYYMKRNISKTHREHQYKVIQALASIMNRQPLEYRLYYWFFMPFPYFIVSDRWWYRRYCDICFDLYLCDYEMFEEFFRYGVHRNFFDLWKRYKNEPSWQRFWKFFAEHLIAGHLYLIQKLRNNELSKYVADECLRYLRYGWIV